MDFLSMEYSVTVANKRSIAKAVEEQAGKMRIFGFDGDERYMINFGYRSRPYQWTVISEFMRIAGEVVKDDDGQR